MSSNKATRTLKEMKDVEMPDVQMPVNDRDASISATHDVSLTDAQKPSRYNRTPAPSMNLFFWRNSSAHQAPPTLHSLICSVPQAGPLWNAVKCYPDPPSPQRSSAPREPLVPRGHGPCNRCGTCVSRAFYQSTWEPERECCCECWEADRNGKTNDQWKEMRPRYILRGVSNDQVEAAMKGEAVWVTREGWGLTALTTEEREGAAEEAEVRGGATAYEGAEVGEDEVGEESGDEIIVVESPPRQHRDDMFGPALNAAAVVAAPLPAPPPSARYWEYEIEPKPAPGFQEKPIEVLQKSTRSGKVIRKPNGKGKGI